MDVWLQRSALNSPDHMQSSSLKWMRVAGKLSCFGQLELGSTKMSIINSLAALARKALNARSSSNMYGYSIAPC